MRTKLFLLAGLLLVAGRLAAADVTEMAFVLKVSGDAKIKTAKQDWTVLQKGNRIRNGDRIKTGENALVSLIFIDDKALMKIRANSEVEVKGEKNAKGIGKELAMQVGEVWNKVTPNGPGFRIETPSGVAAVKALNFILWWTIGADLCPRHQDSSIAQRTRRSDGGQGQMGFNKKGQNPLRSLPPARRTGAWAMKPKSWMNLKIRMATKKPANKIQKEIGIKGTDGHAHTSTCTRDAVFSCSWPGCVRRQPVYKYHQC